MFFRKVFSAFQKVLLVLLAALLLINLYILFMQVAFKADLPKIFGFSRVIVISGSMQPEIDVGDMLIIRQQDEYFENDVVTFRMGNSLVTHRIIEIDHSQVVTQGDENNVADEPSDLSAIEGKVVFKIPKVGSVMLFLKTPFGILCMILVGIALIELPNLSRRIKGKNK